MQVAALSDIHGNAIALSACLRHLDELGVKRIFMLGDLVGYLPGECEAFDMLSAHGAVCQRGNHETYLFAPSPRAMRSEEVYGLEAARARLGAARLAQIDAWPDRRELDLDGHRVLLVHGTPADPSEGYLYPNGDLSPYRDLPYDVVFMGHTHRPFVRDLGPTLIANVGSVGLPRDCGCAASLALFDAAAREVRIVRIRFDVEEVIRTYGALMHRQVMACLRRGPVAALEDIVT